MKNKIDFENQRLSASFRDPSGFVFNENNVVCRAISKFYAADFQQLMSSGLYQALVDKQFLIPHQEVEKFDSGNYIAIIKPQQIPFISYPSSWSFSMLKSAAMLTLKVQKMALKYGMTLKDASAFNIQFIGVQPIFIDTLSFEKYQPNQPWQAYSQFNRHFLAPLALMSYIDVDFHKIFTSHIDGIPLSFATKLLPLKAKFNLGLYANLFLPSKYESNEIQQQTKSKVVANLSLQKLENILEVLQQTIKKLKPFESKTVWDAYYEKDTELQYLSNKSLIINNLLDKIQSQRLLDLGSNDGYFSKIAAQKAALVLSFDIDPNCVERQYIALRKEKIYNIVPLILDVMNPEPAIGWNNRERDSIWSRTKVDTIMALALIHHLAIANNVPLTMIASFFAENTKHLIIEWVAKKDEKVSRLLQNRKDIFEDYNEFNFEAAFTKHFDLKQKTDINETRILYYFERKNV